MFLKGFLSSVSACILPQYVTFICRNWLNKTVAGDETLFNHLATCITVLGTTESQVILLLHEEYKGVGNFFVLIAPCGDSLLCYFKSHSCLLLLKQDSQFISALPLTRFVLTRELFEHLTGRTLTAIC